MQLRRNNPSIWAVDQSAAISTKADQAACDEERRLGLCIKSAQTPLNTREGDEPAGAVTVEKSPWMLRGIDRCGPSSTPRLKVV